MKVSLAKDFKIVTPTWWDKMIGFFKQLKNPLYRNVIKTALRVRPWDFGHLDDLEYAQLKYMCEYFKTSNIAVGNEDRYAELKRALFLLECARGEHNPGHFTGNVKFVPNNDGTTEVQKGNLEYILDRQVNFKNAERFKIGTPDNPVEFYKKFPWDYWEMKARQIYYEYRATYTLNWWD